MKSISKTVGYLFVGAAMVISIIGYLGMIPFLGIWSFVLMPSVFLYPFVYWFVTGIFPWLWVLMFVVGGILIGAAGEDTP